VDVKNVPKPGSKAGAGGQRKKKIPQVQATGTFFVEHEPLCQSSEDDRQRRAVHQGEASTVLLEIKTQTAESALEKKEMKGGAGRATLRHLS